MKRLFVGTMILIIIGSLSYSSVLANSMYEKYYETIKWENSSLLSNIHQVPPPLARNYISIEEQKLLRILTDVNIALEEIKKEGGVSDEKYNEYWDLHEQAENEIKKNNMYDNLSVKDIFNDFSLYLKTDSAIKEAYENLNIEVLEEYAKTLSSRLSKEDNEIERSLLNKLSEISIDYKELNDFSKNAISKLGIIENNVLYVDIKVNKTLTDELMKEIEDKKLTKFVHIKNLIETFNRDSWSKILAHNVSSSEYYSWKDSQKILEGLLASNYISVSSFKTVQDVLSYSPSISLEEKENFTINTDSIVTGVYYDGEKLNENLYVKKGMSLYFSIDYKYTEKPKSKVTIKYVDIHGNNFEDVNELTYEQYIGYPLEIDKKTINGYTFVEIKNNLDKFPKDDSTIQVVYKKDEPKPEPEEEMEEEEEEEEGDGDEDISKNNDSEENSQ